MVAMKSDHYGAVVAGMQPECQEKPREAGKVQPASLKVAAQLAAIKAFMQRPCSTHHGKESATVVMVVVAAVAVALLMVAVVAAVAVWRWQW